MSTKNNKLMLRNAGTNKTKKNTNKINIEVPSASNKKEQNAAKKGETYYLNSSMENNPKNSDIFNELIKSITINDICLLFGINISNKDVQQIMKKVLPQILNLYKEYAIATDIEELSLFLTPLTFYILSNYYIYINISNKIIIDNYSAIQPIIDNMKTKFLEKTSKPFLQIKNMAGGGKTMKGGVNLFMKLVTVAAAAAAVTWSGIGAIANMGTGVLLGTGTVLGATTYLATIPAAVQTLNALPSETEKLRQTLYSAVLSGFLKGHWTVQTTPANAGNVAGAVAKTLNPKSMSPEEIDKLVNLKVAELMMPHLGYQHLLDTYSSPINTTNVEQAAAAGFQQGMDMLATAATTATNAATATYTYVAPAIAAYGQQSVNTLTAFGSAAYNYMTAPTNITLTYNPRLKSTFTIIRIENNEEIFENFSADQMPTHISVGNLQSSDIIDTDRKIIENSRSLYNNPTYNFDNKSPVAIVYDTDSIKIIYRVDSSAYKNATASEPEQNKPIILQETYSMPIIPAEYLEIAPSATPSAVPSVVPSASVAPATATPSASVAPATATPSAVPSASVAPATATPSAALFVQQHVTPTIIEAVNFIEFLLQENIIDKNEHDLEKLVEYAFVYENNKFVLNPAFVNIKIKRLLADNNREASSGSAGAGRANRNIQKLLFYQQKYKQQQHTTLSPIGNLASIIIYGADNNPTFTNIQKTFKNVINNILFNKKLQKVNELASGVIEQGLITTNSSQIQSLFPTSNNPAEDVIQMFNSKYTLLNTSENISKRQQEEQAKINQQRAQEIFEKLSPANQVTSSLLSKSTNRSYFSYYTQLSNYAAPALILLKKFLNPIELQKIQRSDAIMILKVLLGLFVYLSSVSIKTIRGTSITKSAVENVAPAVLIATTLSSVLTGIVNFSEIHHSHEITIARTLMERGFEEGSKMGTFFAKSDLEWTKWGINAATNALWSAAAHFTMPLILPIMNTVKRAGKALEDTMSDIGPIPCSVKRDEILDFINKHPQPSINTRRTVCNEYREIKEKKCLSILEKTTIESYCNDINIAGATPSATGATPTATGATPSGHLGGSACLNGGRRRYKKTKKAPKYKKRKITRRR